MRVRFSSAVLAAGLCIAVAPMAHAQSMFDVGGGGGKQKTPAALPPPPALPGATAGNGAAAPSNRSPSDMEPTEALFDAINRGDIGAARDAINRGADLRGQNVLGMTPIELSVDLGRNDISFMLLSMRGADDTRSRRQAANASTKPPATVRPAKPAPARPAAAVAAVPRTPPPSQTARLFGGDGGAPNPDAGFLGFDPSRR